MIYIIKVNCQELGIIMGNVALLKANPSSHFLTFQKQYDINAAIMAGQPLERGLNPDANSRIGNYYSKRLLKSERLREYDIGNFEKLESSFVKSFNNSFSIPPSLATELGLDKWYWQEMWDYQDPSLPIIVRGIEEDYVAIKRLDTNKAMATIEIARRVNLQTSECIPILVRIAGVAKNNRIVAATYDLTDSNRLTELNVSIPYNDESSWLLQSTSLLVSLPTSIEHPYKTAAFITPEMQRVVRVKDNMICSPHDSALMFRFNEHGAYIGKAVLVSDLILLKRMTNHLGYYASVERETITVGLASEAAQRRGITSWEISIPAALQKT